MKLELNTKYQLVIYKDWAEKNPFTPVGEVHHTTIENEHYVLVPVEDEWVSVEDRLPASGESVLCYRTLGPLSRMVENSWELHTQQNEDWFKKNFSHWRPLLQPPSQTNKPE